MCRPWRSLDLCYAKTVRGDRQLRLAGSEVYRFGGNEAWCSKMAPTNRAPRSILRQVIRGVVVALAVPTCGLGTCAVGQEVIARRPIEAACRGLAGTRLSAAEVEAVAHRHGVRFYAPELGTYRLMKLFGVFRARCIVSVGADGVLTTRYSEGD